MKNIILLSALVNLLIFGNHFGFCQGVSISSGGSNPDASALLDIDATGMTPKKGLLIPRVTLTSSSDAATISLPANSLLVYNLGTGGLGPAGYYYNQGTTSAANWVSFLTNNLSAPAPWMLTGNTGTTASTATIGSTVNSNFIGTTDTKDFVFATNNLERMRINSVGTIGIGTISPSSKAILDIVSKSAGVLFPQMTTAQRAAIASPPEGLLVYDLTAHRQILHDGTRWMETGSVPIGSIQAWHKSFTNTPALPWGWVQCDGQTLSDTDSPYNGQVIPNLNSNTQDGTTNSGMFLRGASTSGTKQAASIADHNHSKYAGSGGYGWCAINAIYSGYTTNQILSGTGETRPPNMTVVWIMKVK